MKVLVVKSKSQSEIKFVADLLKKLGVSTSIMDIEDIEDYGLGILMKEADRTKKVTRDTVMKKLKSK